MFDPLGLTRLHPYRNRRISTYDPTGGNNDWRTFGPGETFTLAEIKGAGVIRHIWITLDAREPLARRKLVLRMTWDDQAHPSVECPIGDFFGQGWGMHYDFSSPFLAAAPREGRALVCYFPMPFATGARITLENQGEMAVDRVYAYVDYDQLDELPAGTAYFHAQYRQELTRPESTQGDLENEWSTLGTPPLNPSDEHNYLWMEAAGAGHFVGVNYYINNPGPMWWGEGDDMFLIDGESWPGLHGTGSEDYFNTSWSPDTLFQHPSFGCAYAPGRGNEDPRFGWMGRTHVYRFHHLDPIRFQKSLRASIEHGHANVLAMELASVAYWYQTLPSRPLLPLPPVGDRIPRQAPDVSDVHRWRAAFRSQQGGALWGDEGRP